jgi:hypothetical protein
MPSFRFRQVLDSKHPDCDNAMLSYQSEVASRYYADLPYRRVLES